DIDPGIAAVRQLDNLAVEPGAALEGRGENARCIRMLECRFAVRSHTLLVRGLDLDERRIQTLGNLLQTAATGARVVDPVVQLLDLAIDPLAGNAIGELRLDLLGGTWPRRRDVADAQQDRGECARDGLG